MGLHHFLGKVEQLQFFIRSPGNDLELQLGRFLLFFGSLRLRKKLVLDPRFRRPPIDRDNETRSG